jgi:hypothetical protein
MGPFLPPERAMIESTIFDGARMFPRALHQFVAHLERGDKARAQQYLDQGLPLDFPFNGRTLLHELIVDRQAPLVRLVLEAGASPVAMSGDIHHLESPLETAVLYSTPEIVALLLEATRATPAEVDRLQTLAGQREGGMDGPMKACLAAFLSPRTPRRRPTTSKTRRSHPPVRAASAAVLPMTPPEANP